MNRNAHRAGLIEAGVNEDGNMEYIGKDKNWNMYTWLNDGVYEGLPEDEVNEKIANYLA